MELQLQLALDDLTPELSAAISFCLNYPASILRSATGLYYAISLTLQVRNERVMPEQTKSGTAYPVVMRLLLYHVPNCPNLPCNYASRFFFHQSPGGYICINSLSRLRGKAEAQ